MSYGNPGALRSTAWLAEHLHDPSVRVLDATFHLPTAGRDAHAEFHERHLPGTRFFDIDVIAAEGTGLPHMLPPPEVFAARVGALGIGNADAVVVYEGPGASGATRAWWTFRVFGHRDVAVLDGGLAKWLAEGRPTERGSVPLRPVTYAAAMDPSLVRSADDMMANLITRADQVIDNRSSGRFAGTEPEPRPARRRGHIPGSVNIPFTAFVDPDRFGVWRPREEIAALFEAAGVDITKGMAATCGSGVTACSTAFAAFLLGKDDVAVYDGSWAEWGNRDDTPVEP